MGESWELQFAEKTVRAADSEACHGETVFIIRGCRTQAGMGNCLGFRYSTLRLALHGSSALRVTLQGFPEDIRYGYDRPRRVIERDGSGFHQGDEAALARYALKHPEVRASQFADVSIDSKFVKEARLSTAAHGKVSDNDAGPVIAQVVLLDAEGVKHQGPRLVGHADDGVVVQVMAVVELIYPDREVVTKLVLRLFQESDPRHTQYLQQIRSKRQRPFNFLPGSSITRRAGGAIWDRVRRV